MLLVVVLAAALAVVVAAYMWVPAVPSAYRLPWAAGESYPVTQGNSVNQDGQRCTSGCATHDDDSMLYAWDFGLPEGTAVLAARAGTVSLINGNWRPDHCGGNTEADSGAIISQVIGVQANFVQIDHGDGTSALYLHLSKVAPEIDRKVKTGEPVVQGEVLGLSGKTGYTRCQPHLHFQVQNTVTADWFTTSQPITFADPDVLSRSPLGIPEEGQSYVSGNSGDQS